LLVEEIERIREIHPRIGGRKLYEKLRDFQIGHGIKVGRDIFFNILRRHNLLLKNRKRRVYTTDSNHPFYKYSNLIKDIEITGINQLWVSDITYWRVNEHFKYISFITDAYSRKIVGYHVGDTLLTIESLQALTMALSQVPKANRKGLIHHSDRGIQYCSKEYVKILKRNKMLISMTQSSDPLDNSIAERVNGIIKNEYLEYYEVNSWSTAQKRLKQAVDLYNDKRLHLSLGYQTPNTIHSAEGEPPIRKWKNYYRSEKKEKELIQTQR